MRPQIVTLTKTGIDSDTATATSRSEPVIIGETQYKSKNYHLLIGYVKNGELPQYLIKNLETGVIEFNHEVLSFAREWITHFQARLDALDAGKNPDAPAEQATDARGVNYN
jgi:hypothetical protein